MRKKKDSDFVSTLTSPVSGIPCNGTYHEGVGAEIFLREPSCAASTSRGDKPSVRWLISPVPNTSVAEPPVKGKAPGDDEVGAPTVINGLIYVGTELGHVMVFADLLWLPQREVRAITRISTPRIV